MARYLTFLIDKKKVGIPYSEKYTLEETHINKVFTDDEEREYIEYKGNKIPVYDTGEILYGIPLKKFDGLIFVYTRQDIIALKTEGFFKESDNVKAEIKPLELIKVSV